MKRLAVAAFLVIMAQSYIFSQISSKYSFGSFLVGGSIGFDSQRIDLQLQGSQVYETHKQREYYSDLHIGYFVYRNAALGIKLNFVFNRFEYATGGYSNTEALLVQPFFRYYLPFGLFGEGSIGYGFYRFGNNNTFSDDQLTTAWSAGIGYSFHINNFIAIEPIIIYESRKYTERVDNQIERQYGVKAKIGLQIFLNHF